MFITLSPSLRNILQESSTLTSSTSTSSFQINSLIEEPSSISNIDFMKLDARTSLQNEAFSVQISSDPATLDMVKGTFQADSQLQASITSMSFEVNTSTLQNSATLKDLSISDMQSTSNSLTEAKTAETTLTSEVEELMNLATKQMSDLSTQTITDMTKNLVPEAIANLLK